MAVAGAKDALELGATLVLPETALVNVEKVVGTEIDSDKLIILTEDKTTIGGVEIYMTSSPHVQDYALLYVPASKAIFQEDHYRNDFVDRPARVTQNALFLKNEVDRLGLDVGFLMGARSRKVENWTEFDLEARKPLLGMCPSNRQICR